MKRANQYTTVLDWGSVSVYYNKEQEHKNERWQVSDDLGITGFATRKEALAFAARSSVRVAWAPGSL